MAPARSDPGGGGHAISDADAGLGGPTARRRFMRVCEFASALRKVARAGRRKRGRGSYDPRCCLRRTAIH